MLTASSDSGHLDQRSLRTLIQTGRLLDVRNAEVLDRTSLLVVGDRVAEIVPPGAPVPAHDRVLDLRAFTVLPGLIDCHTHLIGSIASGGVEPPDLSPELDLFHGVANARATLKAGFTTVRDVGTVRAFHDIRLRQGIAAGLVAGPRMACAGLYVTAAGGGADPATAGSTGMPEPSLRAGIVGDASDAERVVDRLASEGADLVKIVVTGGGVVARPTDPEHLELAPDLIKAIVAAASRRGLPVAAAAHGATGMVVAAAAGARSIEHGTYASQSALEAVAAAGTYLVTDLYSGPWIDARSRGFGWTDEVIERNQRVTRAKIASFGAALAAGVRIAFGTDAGVFPHGENAAQFELMVEVGMTTWQAIQSATVVAASLMGAEADVGVLEPGRYADLVAVGGDPIADISELVRPSLVVKGGAVAAGVA